MIDNRKRWNEVCNIHESLFIYLVTFNWICFFQQHENRSIKPATNVSKIRGKIEVFLLACTNLNRSISYQEWSHWITGHANNLFKCKLSNDSILWIEWIELVWCEIELECVKKSTFFNYLCSRAPVAHNADMQKSWTSAANLKKAVCC